MIQIINAFGIPHTHTLTCPLLAPHSAAACHICYTHVGKLRPWTGENCQHELTTAATAAKAAQGEILENDQKAIPKNYFRCHVLWAVTCELPGWMAACIFSVTVTSFCTASVAATARTEATTTMSKHTQVLCWACQVAGAHFIIIMLKLSGKLVATIIILSGIQEECFFNHSHKPCHGKPIY